VLEELGGLVELMVILVQLEVVVLKERVVYQDLLAPQGIRGNVVRRDNLDHLGNKVLMVKLVQEVHLDLLAILVLLVEMVNQGTLVLLEIMVWLVKMVFLAQEVHVEKKEQLVQEVRLVILELLDNQVHVVSQAALE
jgi:hypothetical protein